MHNYAPAQMPSTNIVTQIKRQVDQSRARQYSVLREKKQLKYYSLYTKQITKIQRYFRGYLVRKMRRLQKQILKELEIKEYLYTKQAENVEQIRMIKAKTQKLYHTNIGKACEQQKENITANIKNIIKNVVNTADDYTKNSAMSKISISQLQKLKKQQKQLKAQIKSLELQKQCYEQRINMWQDKLNQIRAKIMEETSIKKRIQQELESD